MRATLTVNHFLKMWTRCKQLLVAHPADGEEHCLSSISFTRKAGLKNGNAAVQFGNPEN